MKNLHVIPTPNPSSLYKCRFKGHFILDPMNDLEGCFEEGFDPQNIYITNDEEIKEGDWFIRDGSIHKCFRVHKTDIEFLTSIDSVYCGSNTFWSKEFCKKIILTTDELYIHNDLIPKEYNTFPQYIQKIDDEFLEWICKNPSCEEVEVETYLVRSRFIWRTDYRIIITKEEQKQDKVETIPAEEVMEGRSNAYDFIDFDKETFDQYLQRLKDRRTEDNYKYTDEDFKNYIHHIFDYYEKNISVYKCLEFMYFIEREVKLEDVFNDEKKEDVKKVISEHKEKLQKEQDEFAIKFANWLRKEDTPENAEKWFHYSDMDMLNAFKKENKL